MSLNPSCITAELDYVFFSNSAICPTYSYSQKCHTTYTTDFVPEQEEKCEENFKKNCFIEYREVDNASFLSTIHNLYHQQSYITNNIHTKCSCRLPTTRPWNSATLLL